MTDKVITMVPGRKAGKTAHQAAASKSAEAAQPSQQSAPAGKSAYRRPDWEAIHRDYRTGKYSLRELGRMHNCDDGQISRKAKKLGWKQDLTLAIHQATQTAIAVASLPPEVSGKDLESAKIIVAAAELGKQVVLGHRQDIRDARSVVQAMLAEVRELTVNRDRMGQFVEIMSKDAELTASELATVRSTYADLSRLPSRVLTLNRLITAMGRLQELERRAFNLDEPDQPEQVDILAEIPDDKLDHQIRERMQRLQLLEKHLDGSYGLREAQHAG